MTDRPNIPVVPLREAAALLGVSVEAARSALRHHGIRSGYPRESVEWLRSNRPGPGARTDKRPKGRDVNATTSYGTWVNHGDGGVSLADNVAAALGDHGGDYDVPGLVEAYRAAINEALPGSISLKNDNEFYGPYPRPDEADDEIRAALASVDFWEIAASYDRSAT